VYTNAVHQRGVGGSVRVNKCSAFDAHVYCVYTYMYVDNMHVHQIHNADVYRVAKTHRIPYLYRSISTKVTYIQWLFRGK